MRPSTTHALSAVLARQHDVISTRQIVEAGCDHEVAHREVAAQRWQQGGHGVYFAFAGEPTLLQRAWCAQLVGGPTSIVSGALACRLLGIADTPGVVAIILVAAGCHRGGSPGYATRRTSRQLAYDDWDGLRIAEAPRAIIDASRIAPVLRDVRALVCAALNGKHTTYDDLVAERAAEPRAGLGHLGHALEDWSDGARSAPEAEVADALRDEVRIRRMPPFLLNPRVYDGAVLLGSPDVYVPGCALGAETDSVRHHGDSAQLDATLIRHATLTDAGVRLEHVMPTRFRRSPRAWAATFAAIAMERRGIGDPAGLRIDPTGPLQPVPRRRRR